MIRRRTVLAAGAATAATAGLRPARAADTPGVTATEIKIGNTMPYSGPVSSYSPIGKLETAFFNMVNEQGGVAGHKINYISLDDGYSPPKTVEDVRQLIEEDHVAFLFNTLGTPTNSAIVRYVNQRKVPHLFVSTGASKWGDYKLYPWTTGFQPDYRTESQIYAKYILQQKQNPKVAVMYQNDDFGKDYLGGLQAVFGDRYARLVTTASYEPTDATIDSQITSLQATGADVLLVVAAPKFAAQAIRKVYDLNWKPLFLMTNVSVSVGSVITPAGPEKAVGLVSTGWLKDPTDHQWDNDPAMKEWRAFMAKYLQGADLTDINYVYSYTVSNVMLQVLKQCKGNFTRENVMHQAESLHDLTLPTALPGITASTSHTDHRPVKAMRLMRWDGKTWVFFGDIIEATST
ncbi:MAG TPA: ABC transporter substrate-binding protein [Acetobacteraceae bacterium]|jgi:branched-chain amino acid transport system substrate-binding protein|nr:ABC transporter substrate-binding protein [Acetobacteraceae bacterium]